MGQRRSPRLLFGRQGYADTSVNDVVATITLSELWADRPLLIVFLRHFACSCTWRRVERLAEDDQTLSAFGAAIVLVGQGEPERARAFAEERLISQPRLCDPEREVYRAYGVLEGTKAQIVYGAPGLLGPDPAPGLEMADMMRAAGRWLVDSPWQLGAEFLVERGGVVRLVSRYRHCDDSPSAHVVAATLAELGAAGGST